jgi:hypothetical protein
VWLQKFYLVSNSLFFHWIWNILHPAT